MRPKSRFLILMPFPIVSLLPLIILIAVFTGVCPGLSVLDPCRTMSLFDY